MLEVDRRLVVPEGRLYVELPLDVPIRVRPRFELVSLIIGRLLEEAPEVYLFPVEDGRVFIVFLPPL